MQHSDNEVEGGIRVAHNEEQRRFPVAQGIQFQFIVRHDLPQLRNIEGGKPSAAANQNGFQGLARNKLSRTFYQKIGNRIICCTLLVVYVIWLYN